MTMTEALVTIFGGLPVIASVTFSYDSYTMESDAEVEELFWQKKNGKKGKPLPQHLFDRAIDKEESGIITQVEENFCGPPDDVMVEFDND